MMKKTNINPAVKEGNLILLIKSRNSSSINNGKILTVTTKRNRASKSNFQAITKDGIVVNIYYTGPADKFIFANRKVQIEYSKNRIKELEIQIKEINEQLRHLIKYETEEDFVADKLEAILSSHAVNKTKKTRVSAIKEVLIALKKSDFL